MVDVSTLPIKNINITLMMNTACFAEAQDTAVASLAPTVSMSTALAENAGFVGRLAMEVALSAHRNLTNTNSK